MIVGKQALGEELMHVQMSRWRKRAAIRVIFMSQVMFAM